MSVTVQTIDPVLQAHYDTGATTCCDLLKITAHDGTILAVTSLNADVTYDDGEGEVVYSSILGLEHSAVENTSDLSVDNSEAALLLVDSEGFTDEEIEAGILDYAEFVIYRVNWRDLTKGRHEIRHAGTTGIVSSRDGLSGVIELRGLPQWLKQNYITLDSVTCRAEFGGSRCKFDADSLWQSHTVAAIDAEDDRVFTADVPPLVNGPNGALEFVPGLLEWVTGQNAGKQCEVELVEGAVITLRFGTTYPIAEDDDFKIRPDCAKRYIEDCIDKYDNGLEFRGEPYIPLADESSNTTPGAAVYPIYPGGSPNPDLVID